MEDVNKWIKKHEKVKSKKANWNDLWQYIGEYVHIRKQDFTQFNDAGTFLTRDVFDSSAPKANRKMAASLIGLLWQAGGKSIKLEPVRELENSKDVQEYFEWMTETITDALDDPKAGLALALEEYMIDQGSFGTSGIGIFEGEEGIADLRFNAWGVDEISIEEGGNGYVNTIYREFEIPISTAVEDYGVDSLSEKTRKLFTEGNTTDKIRFLHVIAPRRQPKGKKAEGNKGMAFLSLTIELVAKHRVKESGYEEMPVPISRFYKKNGEVYGRSPASEGMPDILELNATKEARISAIEKSLDPPLGVYHDSMLGNEEVDTSARAINVFAASSKLGNRQPIFPLFTVETIREADKSILELKESIGEHFNIDRLLDFNNQTQMTLGEAQMRNTIRSESLGSLFGRQINELFTPMTERSVAIMFRAGKLGVIAGSNEEKALTQLGQKPKVIPDAVAKLIAAGKDFYKLKYLTPAARMMETSEADGVMRTWEFALQVAPARPEILDNLDPDASLQLIGRSMGAPSIAFVDEKTVEEIRKARAQAQAAQAKLEAMKTGGEAMGAMGAGGQAMQGAQENQG